MKRTGARIVWEMLKREGVEVVFGIPGGAIMHTYHPRQEYGIRHHHPLFTLRECAVQLDPERLLPVQKVDGVDLHSDTQENDECSDGFCPPAVACNPF